MSDPLSTWSHEQDRHFTFGEYPFGDAASDHPRESDPSVGGHDDQLRVFRVGRRNDFACRLAVPHDRAHIQVVELPGDGSHITLWLIPAIRVRRDADPEQVRLAWHGQVCGQRATQAAAWGVPSSGTSTVPELATASLVRVASIVEAGKRSANARQCRNAGGVTRDSPSVTFKVTCCAYVTQQEAVP